MKKLSGFEAQTYTQTPNSLFTLLPDMLECELKVVLAVVRLTFGYHREEVAISIADLSELTGLSETSVVLGANIAQERGLIEAIKDGKKTTIYRAIVTPNSGIALPQILVQDTPKFGEQLGVKESIKKEKKKLSKTEIKDVVNSANKTMDKMLELQRAGGAGYWKGRELIREDLYRFADWYHSVTNQVITKKVVNSWFKAMQAWKDEQLSVEALQAAYDRQKAWRVVSDPNQLTKDAVAINSLMLAVPPAPVVPVYIPELDIEEDYVPAPQK